MSDELKKAKLGNTLNAYRKTEVQTANRESILLMLYAGAIRFTKQAVEAHEKKDIAEKMRMIGKVQEIIVELRSTLNFEVGGDIAHNLEALYGFITQRLAQGSMAKDTTALNEVITILTTLNSGWEEAAATIKKERLKTISERE